MKNLFGYNNNNNFGNRKLENREIKINIYCDEVKNIKDPETKEKWHYIGMIIIPLEKLKSALENLAKARYFQDFSPSNDLLNLDKNHLDKNDRIVHFSKMDADTFHIAKRWHSYLKHECSQDKFYFNILGICESRLNEKLFPKKDFITIYNRFFRTAIAYALLKFFPNYKKIVICNVIHERGEQQFHKFFPWHSLYRINKEEKWPIFCEKKEISFIGKDHRKNQEANFLQFIDLLLGVTRNAIHYTSRNKFQNMITEEYLPLIDRLINKPNNPNSKTYPSYHKRMNIDFFPKIKLDPNDKYFDLKRYTMFYKETELRFKTKDQKKLL